MNTINDIKNLRAFEIKYFGPTNYKDSKIKISDLRHNQKIYIDYDHSRSNIKEMVLEYFNNRIVIKYSFETETGYILLSEDFEQHEELCATCLGKIYWDINERKFIHTCEEVI